MLAVLQGGYTKFYCFLCEMDQLSYRLQLQKGRMATAIKTTLDQKNETHPAVGDKSKICLPALHIKIGLKKISVKLMDKSREGFGYLRQKILKISETKMEEETVVDLKITQLF